VADGLLLTRRERFLASSERVGLLGAPALALASAIAALDLPALAGFVAAIAGIAAVAVGPGVRTRAGALIGGVLLAAGEFVFLLVVSWLLAHPILPGS
jgi:hypothetical protein